MADLINTKVVLSVDSWDGKLSKMAAACVSETSRKPTSLLRIICNNCCPCLLSVSVSFAFDGYAFIFFHCIFNDTKTAFQSSAIF